MKKTFKMLLLFLFIFLVVVKVDAKSMYEEEWHNYYEEIDDELYEYNYFFDVVGLNDGSIQLGITDYDISEGEYFFGGLIAKYDASGEEIWKSEKANFYFLKGVKTTDGIVVLGQYFDEDNIGSISLLKYDFQGKLVWEEKIVSEEVDYDLLQLISLDCFNDKIVVGFNNSVYVYDTTTKTLKCLSTEYILPSVTINNSGIYVVSITNDANTVLEKYDLKTYEKIDSVIVYEGTYENEEIVDFTLPLAIKTINNNIIFSSYSISGIVELVSYNKDLEVQNKKNINTLVIEIQADGDGFFAFGKTVDKDPKGLNKKLVKYVNELEEFSFDVPSVKDREIMFWNIDKYAMDLSLKTTVLLEDFYINGLSSVKDGFVFVGEDYYGEVYSYKYTKSLLYTTLEKNGLYNSNMEWLERVVTSNGSVFVTGEYEAVVPRGSGDVRASRYSYLGFFTKLDKDGNVLWAQEDLDVVYLGISDVNDGIIALACDYKETNELSYLYLIKYDYEGNVIWKKTILEDRFLCRWDFEYFSFEVFNNYIAIMLYGGTYLYDIEGNYINKVEVDYVNDEYIMNIHDDGIYLAYIDDNFVGHISKYNFKLELEKDFIFGEHLSEVFSISFVDEKVVLSFDDRLLFMDESLNEVKRIETRYKLFKIEKLSNYYVAFGQFYCQPKSAESCVSQYLIIYDSNFEILEYDYLDFEAFDLGVSNKTNDIYVVGALYDYDEYSYEGKLYKYHLSSYNVEVTTDGNGTITSNKVLGTVGEEIEFSIEPKEGYVLKRVVVTTASGEVIEFTDYKFTMPSEDVEIFAEFELLPKNPNTGLSNPIVIFSGILAIALVGSLVVKKKKFI